jgi:hypothetical protein
MGAGGANLAGMDRRGERSVSKTDKWVFPSVPVAALGTE